MQVTLNNEQWQVSDDATLMEVLAEVSERAASKQLLVTALEVGHRPITDRDLQPLYLGKSVKDVGAVCAVATPMSAVYAQVRETANKVGAELRAEGQGLLRELRAGRHEARLLDAWLGRCADFVEGSMVGMGASGSPEQQTFMSWLEELMQARQRHDQVRLADLLQYEVLPRMPIAA